MELSTERVNGMSMGFIPLSKIWMYLDRFDLPDWWEPVLLQVDSKLVASSNKEANSGGSPVNKRKRQEAH
jgi:hypothetical protein